MDSSPTSQQSNNHLPSRRGSTGNLHHSFSVQSSNRRTPSSSSTIVEVRAVASQLLDRITAAITKNTFRLLHFAGVLVVAVDLQLEGRRVTPCRHSGKIFSAQIVMTSLICHSLSAPDPAIMIHNMAMAGAREIDRVINRHHHHVGPV